MIECPFCGSTSICNADDEDYLFYCDDCEKLFGRYCDVEKCPFRYECESCNHYFSGIYIIEWNTNLNG